MSNKIIYPSIDLFMYDLKEGLGSSHEDIEQNYQNFLRKIYGDIDQKNFKVKYEKIKKYIDRYEEEPINLLEHIEEKGFKEMRPSLDGYYYALQLGDTLALQVDYSGNFIEENKCDHTPQKLESYPFSKLKKEVIDLTFQENGTLGQTWLCWGQLTPDSQSIDVAKACYVDVINCHTVVPDWDRDYIGSGKLLGGELFELWYFPYEVSMVINDSDFYGKKTKINSFNNKFWPRFRQDSVHLLIWLFPSDLEIKNVSEDRVKTSYYDLIRLLQYRHKIIWTYYQSRLRVNNLKISFREAQPLLKNVKNLSSDVQKGRVQLEHLQKMMINNTVTLFDCSTELNVLKNMYQVIEVNLWNYNSRLDLMEEKYPKSDLDFLRYFCEKDEFVKKYQKQLNIECSNFSPPLNLLENLNSTVKNIVDIEITKNQRHLDTTIAIVSVGLSFSTLTATTLAVAAQDPPLHSIIDILKSPVFNLTLFVTVPFLIILVLHNLRRILKSRIFYLTLVITILFLIILMIRQWL